MQLTSGHAAPNEKRQSRPCPMSTPGGERFQHTDDSDNHRTARWLKDDGLTHASFEKKKKQR